MSVFGNRAISASAGTGKTWALAHRYLALLAADVPPDRICALTFSRKAAGEIFDAIVERLCVSALDDGQRAITAESIGAQGICVGAPASREAYVRMLRRLLDQVHRLRVGTLDSFILGVVRAFPLELGLPPDVQPMDNDGGEAEAVRKALLARLCDPRRGERPGGAAQAGAELLDAFRLAMFGRESKGLARRLEEIVAEYHNVFRAHRDRAWGAVDRIWPAGRWWECVSASDVAQAGEPDYLEALRSCFGSDSRPLQLGAACAAIAAAGATHGADRPFPRQVSATLLAQLCVRARAMERPVLSYYGKPYPLPECLWPPLCAAVRNLVRVEVQRSARCTEGLHDVLVRYDAIHAESQRREGRLAFNDFALRLGEPGFRPSVDPHAADRLYIDYRLDGRLDHWLLDEFQDTSDIQWQAIANLADEVVQDAGESRSFFYVGDIKQSIYGWRGGNHRLFGDVARHCGIPRGEPLVACHRSLPAVIRAVNAVFDRLGDWAPATGAAKGPHADAVTAFSGEWQPHVSARLGEGEGFAALLEYDRAGDSGPGGADPDASDADAEGDPAQYEAVARVLAVVEPIRRGLTAAVLVRGNRQGRACADVLRRRLPGVPVVHEGTGGIVDNPVVTLLLALVRYAAHPADSLALRHVQMSPLASAVEAFGGEDGLEGFCGLFLAQVHEGGFAGALRAWGDRLLEVGALRADDAFGRQRLDELLAAAAEFDATGSRDADAFADHIRAHQVKAESAAGAVRVMTVHQSKGLGFDLVVVPFDPSARSFGNPGSVDLLAGGGGDADGWVLQPPPRVVLDAAAGAPLRALDTVRADANFAQLCVLYVAMTRAKRGLYLLVPTQPKKSDSVREADLLRERLCDGSEPGECSGLVRLAQTGDPRWFEAFVSGDSQRGRSAVEAAPSAFPVAFAPETVRREPSKERAEGAAYPAARVFDAEAGDVREFGSAIHRLFEGIEWIDDTELEALVRQWRSEASEPSPLLDDVERQFRRCVASDEVRTLLRRPAGAVSAEAWRETPFSVVRDHDGTRELVMGRFDRLVVERDAAGHAVGATIVDFKSNRVADEGAMRRAAEGYALQMRDYVAAAARILGLPPASVRACLVFKRLARVCNG